MALAGGAVGAPRVTGVVVSGLAAGASDFQGLAVAPAYFRIRDTGSHRGLSVSACNDIRGTQFGLAIGLVNIARELQGLQLGLVNIARNKERFPVLPLVNYHR